MFDYKFDQDRFFDQLRDFTDFAEASERRWCADSARWASRGRHVDHRDRRRVMISM